MASKTKRCCRDRKHQNSANRHRGGFGEARRDQLFGPDQLCRAGRRFCHASCCWRLQPVCRVRALLSRIRRDFHGPGERGCKSGVCQQLDRQRTCRGVLEVGKPDDRVDRQVQNLNITTPEETHTCIPRARLTAPRGPVLVICSTGRCSTKGQCSPTRIHPRRSPVLHRPHTRSWFCRGFHECSGRIPTTRHLRQCVDRSCCK